MGDGSERLPGESARAYKAYLIYRDLGPGRTTAGAWQKYRQTSMKRRNTLGRSRAASTKSRPSGQWTRWSVQWKWVERATAYDAAVDAEKVTSQRQQIEENERGLLEPTLALQDALEQRAVQLDTALDKMGTGPLTGFTRSTREVVGKKVVREQKEGYQKIDLLGMASLVALANEAARLAIELGGRHPNYFNWHKAIADLMQASEGAFGCLPGESMRAYRAFCFYRDQGRQRSLRGAYAAYRATNVKPIAGKRKSERTAVASAPGRWLAWSRRFHWVRRVRIYDALVLAMQSHAEYRRRNKTADRALEIEIAEQDRLEHRTQKILAVFEQAEQATVGDITRSCETKEASRVMQTKTRLQGVDLNDLTALSQQLLCLSRYASGEFQRGRSQRRSIKDRILRLVDSRDARRAERVLAGLRKQNTQTATPANQADHAAVEAQEFAAMMKSFTDAFGGIAEYVRKTLSESGILEEGARSLRAERGRTAAPAAKESEINGGRESLR